MKVKITASCVWTPEDCDNDRGIVKDLIELQPKDIILDYLQDALGGDPDMSDFEVSVEEL